MDYEKNKEALAIVKQMVADGQIAQDVVEKYFPELAESEDEKIRNELLLDIPKVFSHDKAFKYITWLEKQGEQKPTDKVKPKFKIGEWITNGDYTWKIVDINPLDYILQSQDGNIVDDTISHVDEQFHSFTIQDAKDGDVLEFGDHGRLVVGIVSYVNKTTGKVDVNCLLENNNFKVGNYYNLDTIKPHPATKEQRDALMKAIIDAGYTFETENKKLEKIDPKTKENKGNLGGISSNSEWSKEDEKNSLDIKCLIGSYRAGDDEYRLDSWIDSLKDRVQPKQEWSEEDKAMINKLLSVVKLYYDCSGNDLDKQNCISWLKSLRPQKQWKPSDEQIKALEAMLTVSPQSPAITSALLGLYEQLKKLKG